jgi:recombination protein RecA
MNYKRKVNLSEQMKKYIESEKKSEVEELDGNFNKVISTGSTLLDLAISGGRIRGGGIPGGILVEVFGPNSSGKTVILSEIAGNVQRQGGEIKFFDPEARLNIQFAKLFGLDLKEKDHFQPDTVPEVFSAIREWKPERTDVINGVFADSLTALSTDLEMEGKEGDKMGMRRAREFSEELRKTCRILKKNNYLMVCSNQVRQNIDAGPYGQKYIAPGGEAMGFYSSLRLRTFQPEKIVKELTINGKEIKRVIGVRVQVQVFKSSIWKPYHEAPLTILFDYGIDSVRDELKFLKESTNNNVYAIKDLKLSNSLDKAIKIVEQEGLEEKLKEEVINLWEKMEEEFKSDRKIKNRI